MLNQKTEILEKYLSMPIEAKKVVYNMRKNKEVYVWWVVNYSSAISNWIKLFTQSIYSHTNFFDGKSLAIWAEDLEWIFFRDYKNWDYEKFYYVSKKLNLDYMAFIFSFDYIEKIFAKLWKFGENEAWRLKNKFIEYCAFRDNLKLMEWTKDTVIENVLNMSSFKYDVPQEISSQIDWYFLHKRAIRKWETTDFSDLLYQKYHSYLKEFLIIWIMKFIIQNYGKKYDLKGTLSTVLVPWTAVNLWQKDYFCSEFVSEAFIYAGIYPFDINTKDPQSITPWDVMDMTLIFEKDNMDFYQVDNTKPQWDRFKKIWDYKQEQILKNYIIENEKQKMYFIRQKMWVSATSSILWTVSDLSNTKTSTQVKNQEKKRKLALSAQFLILIVLWYLIGLLSNSVNLKTDTLWGVSAQVDSAGVIQSLAPLLWFFGDWLLILLKLFFVLFIGFVLIRYVIPYTIKLKNYILR